MLDYTSFTPWNNFFIILKLHLFLHCSFTIQHISTDLFCGSMLQICFNPEYPGNRNENMQICLLVKKNNWKK